ncbi:MAG: hypothetical protein Q4B54_13180 [Coriobacteriales bacterium]|nr:hypothetical protein [Coriobacteriales bacterium]
MSECCPDCGAALEDFVEGSSMGQRCPGCGWSLVTTYTPPILEDEREYTITLLAGNDVTPAVLKAISRVRGCNYLAARRLVLNAPKALFSGRAADVLSHRLMLEDAGVMVAVTPELPYGRDGRLET